MKKKNLVYDEKTLLVIEGHPYRLAREFSCGVMYPCRICDLRDTCQDDKLGARLMPLCMPKDKSGAWFFVEDWTTRTKDVQDFIDKREYRKVLK